MMTSAVLGTASHEMRSPCTSMLKLWNKASRKARYKPPRENTVNLHENTWRVGPVFPPFVTKVKAHEGLLPERTGGFGGRRKMFKQIGLSQTEHLFEVFDRDGEHAAFIRGMQLHTYRMLLPFGLTASLFNSVVMVAILVWHHPSASLPFWSGLMVVMGVLGVRTTWLLSSISLSQSPGRCKSFPVRSRSRHCLE